ncbi:uncharacterized protein isoform X3 [Danio rerio]|uniref:Uncharacterized protein isoform X3 n=1 Tax=Danio rerio TaxID=7955 RepID=A0AC58JN69_DANRE
MAAEETLLRAVYRIPLLHNRLRTDYRSTERRERVWRDVAASIGLSAVVECKLQREEGVQNLHYWPHRESLMLPDTGKRKREGGEAEDVEEQRLMKTPASPSVISLDEDQLFLLSYVPALKRLTPQKRAAVKMQIQQIMFNAEFKEP